jgi:hypothetical protein
VVGSRVPPGPASENGGMEERLELPCRVRERAATSHGCRGAMLVRR